MTANQFFRVLTFFLGVFIFPALLAIGVWSVKQYGMVLDMSATSLNELGGFGQSSSAAYSGTQAGAMTMTSVLGIFSIIRGTASLVAQILHILR